MAALTQESRATAAEHRRQVARTKEDLVQHASWRIKTFGTRRLYQHGRRHYLDALPTARLARKLANYRLAASHGVRIPHVLKVWEVIEDLDLDGLPETFVLKSDRGAGSVGVLPLRRVGPDFEPVGGGALRTAEDVVQGLSEATRQGKIIRPFFAEELLADRSGFAIPVDLKLYTFYGQVGHVLLRAPHHHGDHRARRRYVDVAGADLFPDNDLSVPIPHALDQAVAVAEKLSVAVPFPFVRVDVYDTPDGIVFGELTLAPGGRQAYPREHDRLLGQAHEEAEARLYRDLYLGRPFDFVYGEHPLEDAPPFWHFPSQVERHWTPAS